MGFYEGKKEMVVITSYSYSSPNRIFSHCRQFQSGTLYL